MRFLGQGEQRQDSGGRPVGVVVGVAEQCGEPCPVGRVGARLDQDGCGAVSAQGVHRERDGRVVGGAAGATTSQLPVSRGRSGAGRGFQATR